MAKTGKPAGAENGAGGAQGPSMVMVIAALVIVTLVAAGGGAFYGMQVADQLAAAGAADKKQAVGGKTADAGHGGKDVAARAAAAAEPGADHSNARLVALRSIITNLAAPKNTWIRLEVSAVMVGEPPENEAVLVAKVADDLVAFLRTLRLSQFEGVSGFQYLRDDLNMRARARSKGKIGELVIRALIVE